MGTPALQRSQGRDEQIVAFRPHTRGRRNRAVGRFSRPGGTPIPAMTPGIEHHVAVQAVASLVLNAGNEVPAAHHVTTMKRDLGEETLIRRRDGFFERLVRQQPRTRNAAADEHVRFARHARPCRRRSDAGLARTCRAQAAEATPGDDRGARNTTPSRPGGSWARTTGARAWGQRDDIVAPHPRKARDVTDAADTHTISATLSGAAD